VKYFLSPVKQCIGGLWPSAVSRVTFFQSSKVNHNQDHLTALNRTSKRNAFICFFVYLHIVSVTHAT
jgi:hypothetical protein